MLAMPWHTHRNTDRNLPKYLNRWSYASLVFACEFSWSKWEGTIGQAHHLEMRCSGRHCPSWQMTLGLPWAMDFDCLVFAFCTGWTAGTATCVLIFFCGFVLLWEGVTFSQGDRSSAHILRLGMFTFTMVWSVFSAPSKAEKCPRQTFLSSVFADTWRHFSACALRVGEPWFLIRHAQAPKNNPIPDAGFLPLGRRHLCKMCSSWQKAHHTPQGYLQSCPCHQGVWTAMGDDF